MRILIQRVRKASVTIDDKLYSSVGAGLLVFVGIEDSDTTEDVRWLVIKMMNLRIFDDNEGIMNLSALDTGSEILIVSQFTLHALVKKGNRPSYIRAARPEKAIPLYEEFVRETCELAPGKVVTGIFGAMMDVSLINDGPVTIFIDSKNRE
jgi:D-aminoacyl-tRNA deacylase